MLKQSCDERWTHGMNGWRVLVWGPDAPVGYGEITGYNHEKQSFYVVLEGAPAGEPDFIHWDNVRPA